MAVRQKETVVLFGSGNIKAANFIANDVSATLSSGRAKSSGNSSTGISISGSSQVVEQ